MSRLTITAIVHREVMVAIGDAARATAGVETGGILLGWWDGDAVVARQAVEVPDPDATTSSWTRSQPQAQHALERALAAHDHPWLGYIGDWHTHPAPQGPSPQDDRSIRRASHGYGKPLLLLVHRADGQLDARVAGQGRSRTVAVRKIVEESGQT